MAGVEAGDPVVSVIIISVGRSRLYELLPELEAQEAAFQYEVLLIANGQVEENRIDSGTVRVHHEPPGKGIPYYRNRGTELARGRIIVYIDDDETPRDASWLARLVEPILEGSEKVTVAGAFIPQGQGFLADLTSMLGYPGGGSLGWRSVWNVDDHGHTDKLCTCNCAIDRALLDEVGGFEESLVYGASDLYLGEALLEKGVHILFVDEAEVVHEARGDMRGFVRWQINRGRSIYDLKKLRPIGQFERGHVSGRLKRTTLILRRTFPTRQFLPMLGVLFCEYFFHAVGYAFEMIEDRSAGRRLS